MEDAPLKFFVRPIPLVLKRMPEVFNEKIISFGKLEESHSSYSGYCRSLLLDQILTTKAAHAKQAGIFEPLDRN